jgi:tripartite-type tricarboxylate transporter receptor subunit TctC
MKRRTDRRSFILGSLTAAALGPLLFARSAEAQAWPSRPVRFIVGLPAGGLSDLYARAYGEYVSKNIGQPVVVENRPGAGSIIACEAVAKSPADGYTFLFTIWTAIVVNQVLYKKLPYDPNKDFTFISLLDAGHLPLAVHKDVPAKNFREFVEFARKNRVTFGTFSAGSYAHMVAAQMNKLYGTQVEAVHFKGEAPMWVELATGRIHAAIGSQVGMSPHLQKEAVRPIAVTGTTRSPKLPEVATFVEQEFYEPVFRLHGRIVLLGPAGLPREIVERISKLVIAAADTPRLREIHANFSIVENPSTPEEFERRFREDGPVWMSLVRELGVTLD